MKYIPADRLGRPCVELTRRNLLVLLAKLDDPDSVRTIMDGDAMISVRAVEDEDHYGHRMPGPMIVDGQLV